MKSRPVSADARSLRPQTYRRAFSSDKTRKPLVPPSRAQSSRLPPASKIPSKPILPRGLPPSGSNSNQVRVPSGRDASRIRDKEELILSVREYDKEDARRKKERDSRQARWVMEKAALTSKVNKLVEKLIAGDLEIAEQIRSDRLDARIEWKLRPHKLVESRIRLSAEQVSTVTQLTTRLMEDVLRRAGSLVLAATTRWTGLWQRKVMNPLEARLNAIEAELDDCYDLLDEYRTIGQRYGAYVLSEAVGLVREITKLKGPGGEHEAHRQTCDNLVKSSWDLATLLQEGALREVEAELIHTGRWTPKNHTQNTSTQLTNLDDRSHRALFRTEHDETALILFKVHQIGVELGSREIDMKDHVLNTHTDLAVFGHRARKIEQHQRMAKHLPEIFSVERHLQLSLAVHVWPGLYQLTGLDNLAHQLIDDIEYYGILEKPMRLRQGHFQQLAKSVLDFSRRSHKILKEFEDTLSREELPWPNRPSGVLHSSQSRLRYLFRMSAYTSESITHTWKSLAMSQIKPDMSFLPGITFEQMRRRLFLIERIDSIISELHHGLEGDIRKSTAYMHLLVFIWAGARSISEGRIDINARIGCDDVQHTLKASATLEESGNKKPFEVGIRKRPKQWIHTRYLYPASESVIIDYVTSCHTLQQVVIELSNERIVGVDIVPSKNPITSLQYVDYISLATENHVYIIDAMSIRIEDLAFFRAFFVQILEDASLLKIMVNANEMAMEIWNHHVVNPTSLYDIAQHGPSNVPSGLSRVGVLSKLLEHHFESVPLLTDIEQYALEKTKDEAPLHFFSYLAIRAYAPLRLFHLCNDGNTVRTSDRYALFDTGKARSDLQEQRSDNKFDPQLGPVSIDAAKNAFTVRKVFGRRKSESESITNFRKTWMQRMSLRMAIQLLHRISQQGFNPSKYQGQSPTGHQKITECFAAFYLATTFCQNLRTIESYLALQNPAQWILWASHAGKAHGLQLHPNDEVKFRSAAGHFDTDLQVMLKDLTRKSNAGTHGTEIAGLTRYLQLEESALTLRGDVSAAGKSDASSRRIRSKVPSRSGRFFTFKPTDTAKIEPSENKAQQAVSERLRNKPKKLDPERVATKLRSLRARSTIQPKERVANPPPSRRPQDPKATKSSLPTLRSQGPSSKSHELRTSSKHHPDTSRFRPFPAALPQKKIRAVTPYVQNVRIRRIDSTFQTSPDTASFESFPLASPRKKTQATAKRTRELESGQSQPTSQPLTDTSGQTKEKSWFSTRR